MTYDLPWTDLFFRKASLGKPATSYREGTYRFPTVGFPLTLFREKTLSTWLSK